MSNQFIAISDNHPCSVISFTIDASDYNVLNKWNEIINSELPNPGDRLDNNQTIPRNNLPGTPITSLSSENDALWYFLVNLFAVNFCFSAIRIHDVSAYYDKKNNNIPVQFKISDIPTDSRNLNLLNDGLTHLCLKEWISSVLVNPAKNGSSIGDALKNIQSQKAPESLFINPICFGSYNVSSLTQEYIRTNIYPISNIISPSDDRVPGPEGDVTVQEGDVTVQEGDVTVQEGEVTVQEGEVTVQDGNVPSQDGNFLSKASVALPINDKDDNSIPTQSDLPDISELIKSQSNNPNPPETFLPYLSTKTYEPFDIIERISNVSTSTENIEPKSIFDFIFMYANGFAFIGAILYSISSIISIDVASIFANRTMSILLNIYLGLCGAVSIYNWFNIPIPVFGISTLNPSVIKRNL